MTQEAEKIDRKISLIEDKINKGKDIKNHKLRTELALITGVCIGAYKGYYSLFSNPKRRNNFMRGIRYCLKHPFKSYRLASQSSSNHLLDSH